MSHRASALVSRVLPVFVAILSFAAISEAEKPYKNDTPAPDATVTIKIWQQGEDVVVDVLPRGVILCEKKKKHCSNKITWELDDSERPLGDDETIHITYRAEEYELNVAKVFQDDDKLIIKKATKKLDRLVKTDLPTEPPIIIWRYNATLWKNGEEISVIDPRVVIDRSR